MTGPILLPLLAGARMHSVSWTLAWAFLIAALLWLLVWQLLRFRMQKAAESEDHEEREVPRKREEADDNDKLSS